MRPTLVALALATLAAPAIAGDLIPTDTRFGPLRVKLHRVETTIDNQIAVTKVTQIFANDHDAQLEAIYVFPTPSDATLIDFSMTINGKVMRGELLEKNKARAVYEKIVSRAKDPGLLEQVGKNVFRMRVFPILPKSEQKIELTYVERITYENGRCTWRYPLKVPGSKETTRTDSMEFSLRLTSEIPIQGLTCATHPFTFVHSSAREATAVLNEKGADLTKDVELVYTLARPKSGFDVVAHRTKGDGTFAMLITPSADENDAAMAKDMTFVFDTSGSMQGKKMEQARAALKFCINALKPQDRFNIIRFSDDVQALQSAHVLADETTRAAAVRYVDRLEALGSTNISGALARALEHKPEPGRPHMILFLTDGMPTAGDTDAKRILQAALKAGGDDVRIFTFGVGDDVNRGLLEDLSESTRAVSSFVATHEDLEAPVARLQRRIVAPVISGLEIDWGGADVHNVYPKRISDLYAGVQLMVTGRYGKSGESLVTLKGKRSGREFAISQVVKLPESRPTSDALPYLWGARRIADLLDTIRRNGENREIVADVVRLSREYRVATPYTSFLVLEDEAAYDREGIDRKGADFKKPDSTAFAPRGGAHDATADDEEFGYAKGDSLDFKSDKPFKSTGTYDVIGGGGGGGGRYGSRLGDRAARLKMGCGSVATEDAVSYALRWLAAHQNADGSWPTGISCSEAKCAVKGAGDVEATALSLLAFLGAGYSHLSKDAHDGICFGDVVRKALQWIMSHQDPEGCIGSRKVDDYLRGHLIAAMALSEALGLTGSNLFKDQAQKAVDFTLSAQPDAGGWGTVSKGAPRASISTWGVMSLKSAELSGLDVRRETWKRILAWIDSDSAARGGSFEAITRIFVEKNKSSAGLRSACESIAKQPPSATAKDRDVEAWFMNTLALFQYDGPSGALWKSWNETMKDALVKSQATTKGMCTAGSWEPAAGQDRVRTTALDALTLEVYYRYANVFGNK